MEYLIVEKKNHLAVHGIYHSKERAEWALSERIPEYCKAGFYMDKNLKPESFEVIPKKDKTQQK